MLRAAPIEHNRLTRTAQIIDCDGYKRVLPLHIFQIDLERAKIGWRKFAGKKGLRPIDHRFLNSAMQLLHLHVPGNV